MKVAEIKERAESVKEQGDNARQAQIQAQRAVSNARAQLASAQEALEYASRTDADGNPVGDVYGARGRLMMAQTTLMAANSSLQQASRQVANADQKKRDVISEIDRYTAKEEKNLSVLKRLQGKKFGAVASAFVEDLVDRMNEAQDARAILDGGSGPRYFGGLAGVGSSDSLRQNPVEGVSFGNSVRSSTYHAKKSGMTFGSFSLGRYKNGDYVVKGDNFDRYMDDYDNYDKTEYKSLGDDSVVEYISTSQIEGIHLGGGEAESPEIFWNRRGEDGEEWFEGVASHIPEVRSLLESGVPLSEIKNRPHLERCAHFYFEPSEMPQVERNDGYYVFQTNGRHRILAARKLGYDIPVRIVGERKRVQP